MSTWNKHYHWKTKNATPWTKEYFRRKLVGTGTSESAVQIDSLTNFEGDVELGNRKGKLITIYDCSFTLEWSGKTSDGEEVKGQIHFPEVSHEVADEEREYPFEASLTSKASDESVKLRDLVRKEVVPGLLPHFHAYRSELIAENAKDVGHEDGPGSAPNGGSSASSGTSTPAASAGAGSSVGAGSTSATSSTAASAPKKTVAKAVSTTKVDVSTDLSIRREDLWGLLTEPGRIPMWTRAPAQFTLNPGSHFSLFNNNVTGSIVSVEAPTKLVQQWRPPQWETGHHGTLTTTLVENDSSTTLKLELEGVPIEEEARTKDALDRFYIAGLKGLGLGTGSLM